MTTKEMTNKATYQKNLVVDNKAEGVKTGLLFFAGLALCFTGIGALIGIPMVIYARNPKYIIHGGWKTICPSCDNEMLLPYKEGEAGPLGVNCKVCKSRVIFKNSEVYVSKVSQQQSGILEALKNGKFSILVLIAALLLQGCTYPGKPDLVRQGTSRSVTVNGDYKKIAHCITDATVNEEFKFGELQATANIFRPDEDNRMIEIGYTAGVSSIYLWLAEVRQIGKGRVRVDIVGRNEIPIAGRSVDYFSRKIEEYAKKCGK